MAAPCERAVWRTWTAPEWPMRADWNCDVNRDGALMSWPTHRPTSGAGLAPKPLLVGGSSDLQSIRELDNGRSCEWAFRDGDVGQVDRRNRSGTDCCSGAIPSAVLILLLVLLFSAVQGVAARLKIRTWRPRQPIVEECSLFDRTHLLTFRPEPTTVQRFPMGDACDW